jgi:phage gp36-like protein
MPYCTRQDIADRVGEDLLQRIADADQDGAEDLATITQAIADVDGQITARIAGRWPTYVGIATPVLLPIAVDLVVDRLARDHVSTEDIQRRAAQARADLAAIGRGEAVPDPAEAAVSAADADDGEVIWEQGRREFSGGGY